MTELNDEKELDAVSDGEKTLAVEALKAFRDRDTKSTVVRLNQLRDKRPKDSKVLHNCLIASSESSASLLTQLEELVSSLDCDEVDSCVIHINIALLHFRKQRFHHAQKLLERFVHLVEPLGEGMYRDALLLYMETCLKLNYPERVPKLIATLESLLFGRVSTPRPGDSSPQENRDQVEQNLQWKPIVNQYRVRCLLALHSLKACKREVKNLNGEEKDRDDKESFGVVMSAFVRAQLEQQRDSGRKAIKILNTLHGREVLGSRHLATLYYNDMAAIHFKAGKISLAVMHAHRALDEYKRQVRCGEVHQTRMFFYILLNLAICKLFCGSIRSAFEDLKGCARLMNNSPLVWMRLAECSLLVHNETITRERKQTQVCETLHGRVLLSGPTRPHDLQQEITNESQMEPTLQLAIQALRVCLSLIADHEMTLTAMETPGDGNAPCASALQELRLLSNSALCASAYASLCVGDFVAAQDFSELLLIQERLSSAQRMLGHLYCAEALLMQDQLSEAVEHLCLDNVEEVSIIPPNSEANETQWESQLNMPWLPSNKKSTLQLFRYNLAMAFVLREELHKAEETLRPLLDEVESGDDQLDEHVLWLAIYLNLQQNEPDKAKKLICKFIPNIAYNSPF